MVEIIPPIPDKTPVADDITSKPAPLDNNTKTNKTSGVTRTFFTDVVDVKGSYDEGYLSRKLYEERRRNLEEEEKHLTRRGNFWWATLSIILIISGLLSVIIILKSLQPTQISISDQNPYSHIRVDIIKDINLDEAILDNFTDKTILPSKYNNGETSQVVFLAPSGEAVTFMTLAENLEWKVPPLLLQSIEPNLTFGILHGKESTAGARFIILSVNSVTNAIDGMSRWEEDIVSDLSDLLAIETSTILLTQEFTSTVIANKGAKMLIGQTLPNALFKESKPEDLKDDYIFSLDELIGIDSLLGDFDELLETTTNTEIEDSDNFPILIYGFANENTLVITTNSAAFSSLTKRLNN